MTVPRALGAAAILIVGLLVIWLAFPVDRTAAVLRNPRAYIESGEKFGVSIGDTLEVADRTLVDSGLTVERSEVSSLFDNCALRPMRPGETLAFYGDRSWRNGYICIVTREERVVAVGWNFGPFAP